ncbi:MAG: hypothetical protein M0R73_06280 [Dehalococcoidia bacterium]|nr:hypothetical protein [Dehalococcoidia bacterium]
MLVRSLPGVAGVAGLGGTGAGLVALVLVLVLAVQGALLQPVAAQVAPEDTPLRLRWTWPGPVTFCADSSVLPAGVTAEAFRGWVQQAMDAWNATEADVELRLTAAPCARATGNLRNEVGFETYRESPREVGRAYSTTQGGTPVEGDITLRLNWETSAHCRISTLVHEFGHILGFTHSEWGTDIMGYGPCGVLQPSAQEVAMLVAGYGRRASPLALASTPPSAGRLTLGADRRVYPAQQGAYYFEPAVAVTGGGALVLRAPECFTSAAPDDDECTSETSLPSGYWPAAQRQSPLPEVPLGQGRATVRTAASLGHLARPLAACNALGCAAAVDVRAGEVRVGGTGVDFAYLVHPLAEGGVSVQVANVSFFAPPNFLDVAATFEVRTPGVNGPAGRLASCVLSLGEVCEVTGNWGGSDLEVVLAVAATDTRTGVRVASVRALAVEPEGSRPVAGAGSGPVSAPLPASGLALVVWNGGPVSLAEQDPRIGAIFVTGAGVFVGYVVGAPTFVNAAFLAQVGPDLGAGTVVMVVVR